MRRAEEQGRHHRARRDTVKIQLTSPQPWFIQQLSHTSFIPANKAAVTKWGDKWTEPAHIVSDGPFTLTSWKHDASLTLVKNPDYYDARDVKLDTVQMKIITEGATAEQAFDAGDVDVNDDRLARRPTRRASRRRRTYQQFPSLGIYYYGFNVKKITDVNQRKAMALAIDRQAIVDHITQTGQVPATAFSPEGIPGASTINKDTLPARRPRTWTRPSSTWTRSRTRSRDINLSSTTRRATRRSRPRSRRTGRSSASTSTLKQQDWPQFLKFLGPPPDASVGAYRNGWIADFPDDINFLSSSSAARATTTRTGATRSTTTCSTQATAEPDQAKRYDLYQQAEAMLTGPNGDMPIAPIYWYTFAYQVADRTSHGWNTNPMDTIDLTKVASASTASHRRAGLGVRPPDSHLSTKEEPRC